MLRFCWLHFRFRVMMIYSGCRRSGAASVLSRCFGFNGCNSSVHASTNAPNARIRLFVDGWCFFEKKNNLCSSSLDATPKSGTIPQTQRALHLTPTDNAFVTPSLPVSKQNRERPETYGSLKELIMRNEKKTREASPGYDGEDGFIHILCPTARATQHLVSEVGNTKLKK